MNFRKCYLFRKCSETVQGCHNFSLLMDFCGCLGIFEDVFEKTRQLVQFVIINSKVETIIMIIL